MLRKLMALPRYGNTDEIAALVAYLAGSEAGFVTGASLTIDGGFTASPCTPPLPTHGVQLTAASVVCDIKTPAAQYRGWWRPAMKAIRLHVRGGPEAFVYEEAPQPHPQAGEVLVRVHAAAVTPTELLWGPTWKTRTGEDRPFPIILGHEFSGVIAALGTGVTDWAEGDPVYGLNDWFADGA
jgi:hypothetical protein